MSQETASPERHTAGECMEVVSQAVSNVGKRAGGQLGSQVKPGQGNKGRGGQGEMSEAPGCDEEG